MDKRNLPPRPQGMSQLDYLWLNFGGRTISSELSREPSDNVLLTEKAIANLAQSLLSDGVGISHLTWEKDPDHPGMMRLMAFKLNGDLVQIITIPEEVHVAGFVGRKATQADVDNGFKFPVGSKVLSLILTNGEEFLVSLEELNLVIRGAETDTIINEINDLGAVHSNLKIDAGNTSLSVIKLKSSSSGLYANLEISKDYTGINLVNKNGTLKAEMPIGTTGYVLKVDNMTLSEYMNIPYKDPGTVYFISDIPYIFLGDKRYGVNIKPGDAPIVSLVYDPITFTLAYKRADKSDIQLISLGPVSEVKNGMMTKEQYIELLKLKTALDGIVDVKLYIAEQVSSAGFELQWGEIKPTTKELLLKNKFGDIISRIEMDRENFLDFAESRKATFDDVIEAAKQDVLISEGEQIFVFTLVSQDKIYVSAKELIDVYTARNTKSIRMQISHNNEISADLNISEQDKMLFVYDDGLASHILVVREHGKVTFYGKTISENDKLGEFDLADPRIKTIFVESLTEDLAAKYPPRLVDGQEYDRLVNPVTIGEPYLIECFGNESADPSMNFRYNDYISVLPMVNGFTLSPKDGNILERDENKYLYASVKLIDV